MKRYRGETAAVVLIVMLAGLLMPGCARFRAREGVDEPGVLSEQQKADSASAEPPAASSALDQPMVQGRPASTKPPATPPPTSGSPSVTGKISGKGVRQDGSALAYANVMVEGTMLDQATDELGKFAIAGVPSGNRRVRVSMVGFADTVLDSVTVRADLSTTVGPVSMMERQPPVMDEIVVTAERMRVIWCPEGTSRIVSRSVVPAREDGMNEVASLVADTPVCKPGTDMALNPAVRMLPPDEERTQKAFQTAASPGGARMEDETKLVPFEKEQQGEGK